MDISSKYDLLRAFVESMDTKDNLFKEAVLEGIDAVKETNGNLALAELGLRQIGKSPYYITNPDKNDNILLVNFEDDGFELDVDKASEYDRFKLAAIEQYYEAIDAKRYKARKEFDAEAERDIEEKIAEWYK